MSARRPRRKIISPWIWVPLSALALWLLALAYLTFGQSHGVVRGDPLLEMYLNDLTLTGQLKEDTLAKWGKLFPDDPRIADLSLLEWVGQANWNKELDYIQALQSSGVRVSGPVLLAYILKREGEWSEETDAYKHAPSFDPQHRPPPAVQGKMNMEWERKVCHQIDQAHRAERDHLYALLQQTAPSASMTWYTAANLAFGRGDNAQAIKFLQKGNAAKHNSFLLPYPLPLLIGDLRRNGPLAKDPRAVKLWGLTVAVSFPNFIQMKRMHHALWRWAAERKDGGALNVIHTYSCRVGVAEDGEIIEALVSQIMLGYECQYMLKEAHLNTVEKKAIVDLQVKQRKVVSDIRAINTNTPYLGLLSRKPRFLDYLHFASGSQYYRAELQNMAYEQHELVTKIFPQIEQMARFDFTTMSFAK